jgi:hypothetical protein
LSNSPFQALRCALRGVAKRGVLADLLRLQFLP